MYIPSLLAITLIKIKNISSIVCCVTTLHKKKKELLIRNIKISMESLICAGTPPCPTGSIQRKVVLLFLISFLMQPQKTCSVQRLSKNCCSPSIDYVHTRATVISRSNVLPEAWKFSFQGSHQFSTKCIKKSLLTRKTSEKTYIYIKYVYSNLCC